MRIIRSASAMTRWSQALLREGVRIGFVPTMGALHAGHRALIRTARLSSDALVVSVFVNPTQFGPNEDFKKYPRTEKADLKVLKALKVDIVFAPKSS